MSRTLLSGIMFQRQRVRLLSFLCICLVVASCQPGVSENTHQLLLAMNNSDVKWDGNFVGLWPQLSGPTLELQKTHEPIEALLLDALLDRDRYVAAHMLLTLRTTNDQPFIISAQEWNGLHVQLFADGTVTYEGNDLDMLYQRWSEELADKAR